MLLHNIVHSGSISEICCLVAAFVRYSMLSNGFLMGTFHSCKSFVKLYCPDCQVVPIANIYPPKKNQNQRALNYTPSLGFYLKGKTQCCIIFYDQCIKKAKISLSKNN